jgi:hypothetical protein
MENGIADRMVLDILKNAIMAFAIDGQLDKK